MQIIDDCIDDSKDGVYLLGKDVSLADATLFPTMVFAKAMIPKFDDEKVFPKKIGEWFDGVIAADEDFAKVYEEMMGGIRSWEQNKRWDTIHQAGKRDTNPPTIFDKIIAKQIPSTIVYETDDVLAFKDINPVAPAHVLVIPKDRDGLSGLRVSSPDHVEILGKLLVAAGEIARDESLGFGSGGARFVINDGEDAGQEVPHLHVHVIGGRKMGALG